MANIFNQVLFNNGEGLEYTDLNALQDYASALLNDGIIQEKINAHLSTAYLYTGGPATVPMVTSATLLRTEHGAGMVWQLPSGATVDGLDPALLAYYISTNEFQHDHAAQHATLERYDIICLQLAYADGGSTSRDFRDSSTNALTTTTVNKKRRVTCTKQVVQGVNAAVGTAVEPATPVGFVKWRTVRIRPVSEGNGDLNDDLLHRDYTVPLTYGGESQSADFFVNSSFGTSAFTRKVATAGAQVCYIIPHLPPKSRLMTVELTNLLTGGSVVQVVRLTPTAGGFSENVLQDISSIASAGGLDTKIASLMTGTPVWDNSWPNRLDLGSLLSTTMTDSFVAIKVTSGASGDQISKARFFYAKG